MPDLNRFRRNRLKWRTIWGRLDSFVVRKRCIIIGATLALVIMAFTVDVAAIIAGSILLVVGIRLLRPWVNRAPSNRKT